MMYGDDASVESDHELDGVSFKKSVCIVVGGARMSGGGASLWTSNHFTLFFIHKK